MDVDSAPGAAMRRRQRRLSQSLRHERPERRYGPCREVAPHLKGSEVCQARGGGARGARRVTTTEALLLPSRSSSSCTRKSPAVPGHPVWVSRGGRRRRSSSAPSSCSPTSYPWCRFWTLLGCWGGLRRWRCCGSSTCRQSSRTLQCPRYLWTRSPQRAALRRPQKAEQLIEVPTEPGYPRAVFAVQARGRRVAAAIAEQIVDNPVPRGRWGVFQVYVQDRVLQRRTWSRSLTLQFLRVGGGEVEVFKVLSLDRVQQRMWSRSLLFLLVEVSKVFSQARVPHRVDSFKMRMRHFKGFSHFSPEEKKCGVGSALGVGIGCGL